MADKSKKHMRLHQILFVRSTRQHNFVFRLTRTLSSLRVIYKCRHGHTAHVNPYDFSFALKSTPTNSICNGFLLALIKIQPSVIAICSTVWLTCREHWHYLNWNDYNATREWYERTCVRAPRCLAHTQKMKQFTRNW